MTNNTDNNIEQIGLQLWKALSASIGGEVGGFIDLKDIFNFGEDNSYEHEQVRVAFEWCLKQEYLTKAKRPDRGYGVMLIKAYQ